MEVGELVKLHNQKRNLLKQRDSLVREEAKRRQKEKVNLDQSAVKKGYIEKHKYIAKKKYETVVEKTKKIPIELQDNVNPNTFLSRNANFKKILERTKNKIKLNRETIKTALLAVNAYGIANKESIINFTLHFQQQISCQPKPSLIQLPHPTDCQKIIIVLPSVKEKEGQYAFESIKSMNLAVMSSSQFIEKAKSDAVFSKKISQQQIKCFVKFELFKKSKFYMNLLKKGVPVFPIDSKKVPFCLQQDLNNYPDYIEFMAKHYLAITKSGQDQTFKLKTGLVDHLLENSCVIIPELTAKLIERSKTKSNKLLKVSVKTASSINFDIYQAE